MTQNNDDDVVDNVGRLVGWLNGCSDQLQESVADDTTGIKD